MAGSNPDLNAAVEVVDPRVEADWDREVSEHPEAGIFHSAAWARVLVDSYGFRPQYLVRREAGKLAGFWPVMEVHVPFRPRRGVALPFTDSCPPVESGAFAPLPEGSDSISLAERARRNSLLGAALRVARERGWRSVEFREATAWTGTAETSVMFYGHCINLSDGEDAVWERCASAVRRAVRKADAGELRTVIATDSAAMRDYYDLHCLTRQRHGAPPQSYTFFERIQRHLLESGKGFIVLARKGELAVAGAVYFQWGRQALYKFGASNEAFQALRPNNLVFREAIRECLRRGCQSLDLGRSSLDNDGLRRFKLGWGAVERLVPYVRYNLSTSRIESTPDRTSGWQTRVFRSLPLSVSRLLGSLLYRFAA